MSHKRTAIINIVGLCERLIGERTPNIQKFVDRNKRAHIDPVLPALTCSAQATYLTGTLPSEHGIVANGWYDRDLAEHHFWKQSNHLVKGKKLWEAAKEKNSEFTCAKLFWWYNMYSSADWSITPRPMYPADGNKFFDVYTQPQNIRHDIKESIGDFPFPSFWGPMAGIKSSDWIAESAKWIEEKNKPNLSLVYLPHLDYNLQRLGPNHLDIKNDLLEIDKIVGDLISFYEQRSIKVSLLSEYGITEVNKAIQLNRVFRKNGRITIKEELGLELMDCGASKAFAICDHQIAHIYLNDQSIKHEAIKALENTDGISKILHGDSIKEHGLNHERSGDIIVISNEDTWFSYYYWLDDAVAPDFARCIDIHRKYGYDPVELFLDPDIALPKLKIIGKLIQKKLGFRMLMDVIPLDDTLVKGSHGCRPKDKKDWPLLISENLSCSEIQSVDVYHELLKGI